MTEDSPGTAEDQTRPAEEPTLAMGTDSPTVRSAPGDEHTVPTGADSPTAYAASSAPPSPNEPTLPAAANSLTTQAAGSASPIANQPTLTTGDSPTAYTPSNPPPRPSEPTIPTGDNSPTFQTPTPNQPTPTTHTTSNTPPSPTEPTLPTRHDSPTFQNQPAGDSPPIHATGSAPPSPTEPTLPTRDNPPTFQTPTPNQPTLTTHTTSNTPPSPTEPTLPTRDDSPTFQNQPAGDSPPMYAAGSAPPIPGTNPPSGIPHEPDELPTINTGDDSPTMTGPTVGSWPFDETDADLPGDLIWHSEPHPQFDNRGVRETHSPGYYISLGAAVVIVIAVVAAVTALVVVRPGREVAGSAQPTQGPPSIETPSTSTTGEQPTSRRQPVTEELAEHPLSASTDAMDPSTCELPKFDPADAAQKTFYEAAKVCADAAWRPLLAAAELPAADVTVITVIGAPAQTQCGEGEVAPDDSATQCQGTVYMTPAHLRDKERNDRFPGRYFGVFLREYAEAVQYQTGLTELTIDVDGDLTDRLAQQATCLAGIAAGAMAGRGAVDTNITNEIRDRLTTVDAPPDAAAWFADGFQSRQPSSCNTWLN